MRILLKEAKLPEREGLWDIFIEGEKIESIAKCIEKEDIDFRFCLNKRIVTPPLVFSYTLSSGIEENSLLLEIIKNGIKTGHTFFAFSIKNGKAPNKRRIIEMEEFFRKTYVKGIIMAEGMDKYEGEFIQTGYETVDLKRNESIEEKGDASLVVWDTNIYLEGITYIPYIVISLGKIILREGETIFL